MSFSLQGAVVLWTLTGSSARLWGRGWSGAGPHDEFGGEHDAALGVVGVEEHPAGDAPSLGDGLAPGREAVVGRRRNVVEPDEGQVTTRCDAALAHGVEHAEGEDVAHGDDRGGAVLPVQQVRAGG